MSNDLVRKKVREQFLAAGQFPLQTVGSVAVGGSALPVSRGQHELLLGGSTGIVATQYGLHNHGVTVGRLGTGIYSIRFPDTAHVRIDPSITVPTGFNANVSVGGISGQGRIVGATGQAFLYITQSVGQTGVQLPCAPATGTVVTLDFEFSGQHQHGGSTLVPY